jgi:riboflavin synthase
MFTGIVVERGVVKRAKRRRGLMDLEVEAPRVARELRKGDSVAVNGVCLTATATGRRRFSADLMEESLMRTSLGELRKGAPVNLELPVRMSDRLGGHIVQGHVDGVARVIRVERSGTADRAWFAADDEVLRYLVPKGSVAIDGVAMTVVDVGRASFQVALIPHTLENTTLGGLEVGARVNIEVDVLAKYVERLSEGKS